MDRAPNPVPPTALSRIVDAAVRQCKEFSPFPNTRGPPILPIGCEPRWPERDNAERPLAGPPHSVVSHRLRDTMSTLRTRLRHRLMPQKKKNKSKRSSAQSSIVCRNRKARYQYDILEELECGIALQGSEVKSIRNGKISIDEAYVRVRGDELWLVGSHIAEYPQAALANHDPLRPRKLLAHKRQIQKLAQAAEQKGLTLIPLSVYFSRGFVKVRIAVARGRKLHDKREKLRKEADRREIRQRLGRRRWP